MRRWWALSVFALVTACGDPSGPGQPESALRREALAHIPKGMPNPKGNSNLQIDVPTIPEVYVPQSFQEFCENAINAAGDIWAEKTQSMTYTDATGRPTDSVAAGALSVPFRRWEGTWQGQVAKCMKIRQIYLYRLPYPPNQWTPGPLGARAFWWASDDVVSGMDDRPNWAMCLGATQCAAYPPKIWVTAELQFHRECGVGADTYPQHYLQYFYLGGLQGLPGPPFYPNMKLELNVNGSWSLVKTGGELTDGERGYLEPSGGLALCSLFYYTYPDPWAVYQHRVGVGKWRAPY